MQPKKTEDILTNKIYLLLFKKVFLLLAKQLSINMFNKLGKPSIKKTIFLLTFVNKRGGSGASFVNKKNHS